MSKQTRKKKPHQNIQILKKLKQNDPIQIITMINKYQKKCNIIILLPKNKSQQRMSQRKDMEAYPQTNLSNQLLLHQQQMLQFLFFTNYDIIYETFQLKHGSYAERNRGHIQQTFKSQEIARHYKMVSEKMHLRILRDDIDLDKQFGKLEVLWHNRNTPYFHRYYYVKFLYTCYFKDIQPNLIKEEQLIRSEQHLYFTLFRSINARQACLRNLKKLIAELSPQDVYEYLHIAKQRLFNEKRKNQREKYKAQGYKLKMSEETFEGKMSKTKFQNFSDCFNHLTKLTLYIIELIAKWKEYIGDITHDNRKKKERMQYYFYDDNYFLKILTDFGFVKVSFLNQFYEFAPKNDPFMLQCVLAFERKKEKTVQHELLKQIFMPPREHLAQILNKIELLSEEYRYNIRSRKVFDLNVLKKPLIRAEEKMFNNQAKEQMSNLVLKKIQSPVMAKKSKSVATFRVRQGSGSTPNKKGKIVVEFKSDSPSVKKKVPSYPGSTQKIAIDRNQDSPLKNSIITQKNETSLNISAVDMNLLNVLKQEIVKKVREQFDLHKGQKNHQSQALELFIDTKIKDTMKKVFPFEPEKQLKQPLEFTPISIKDVDLSTQVEAMFKKSVPEYREMQHNLVDLVKILEQSQYVYFLVGKIGDQEIGRVLCSLQKDITEFKVLKILYLHFCQTSQIQTLILKFVEFLWQYENSFQVHFNFFQPSNNDPIKTLLQSIQQTLQKECIFARKQLYSTIIELKLIFKRQNKNVNYFPNKYPFSLHVHFDILLASKKLMLENRNQYKHLELLNYDYFLMQIIKKMLSSQDILTLKQKITWRNRLRILIQMLKEEEERDLMIDKLIQVQAGNISELNGILTKMHHPFLQVSDLVKTNHVTLLTTNFTLTPKFTVKTVNDGLNQRYYRLDINDRFTVRIDQAGTEFYLLPTEESKDYQILVFSAKDYLKIQKEEEICLNEYLTQRISRQEHGMRQAPRVINSLWIPMNRFPGKYKEREEVFTHTIRVLDLAPLKMDVLLGQKMQWLCNMELENSIKFSKHQADCHVDFPCGIGIVAAQSKAIIYTRIFH